MFKYLIAILIILVGFLSGGLYYSVRTNGALRAERDSLVEASERAVERAKLDRAALVAREALMATQARKYRQAQEALSEALQRNKAWSDTDVPIEVQSSILGRSGGPVSPPD